MATGAWARRVAGVSPSTVAAVIRPAVVDDHLDVGPVAAAPTPTASPSPTSPGRPTGGSASRRRRAPAARRPPAPRRGPCTAARSRRRPAGTGRRRSTSHSRSSPRGQRSPRSPPNASRGSSRATPNASRPTVQCSSGVSQVWSAHRPDVRTSSERPRGRGTSWSRTSTRGRSGPTDRGPVPGHPVPGTDPEADVAAHRAVGGGEVEAVGLLPVPARPRLVAALVGPVGHAP